VKIAAVNAVKCRVVYVSPNPKKLVVYAVDFLVMQVEELHNVYHVVSIFVSTATKLKDVPITIIFSVHHVTGLEILSLTSKGVNCVRTISVVTVEIV